MVEEQLRTFLRAAAKRKFKYGEFDCGLWLADWLVFIGRPDPAIHLRGTYSTIDTYLFKICRTLWYLERTSNPSIGDVGVIQIAPKHYVGAICSGKRWVVLAEGRGVSALNLSMVGRSIAWKAV